MTMGPFDYYIISERYGVCWFDLKKQYKTLEQAKEALARLQETSPLEYHILGCNLTKTLLLLP